jgi:membrane-associated protease RseP (regulator of RpoE activity)
MRHLRIVLAVAIMAFAAFGFAAAQDATSTPLPETAAPEATTVPEATTAPETDTTDATPAPFMGILFEAADQGVLVIDILAGSPAEDAGIEVGDVVTAINGEAVTQDTVRSVLAGFAVGDTVTVDVTRGEESLSLDVTLGEEPESFEFRGRGDRTPRFEMFEIERPRLGIGIGDSETGVIVNEVAEGSPAEAAGVLVGDIITAINNEAVATPQEAAEAVGQAITNAVVGEFDVTVTVTRGEETLDLVATLVKPEIPAIPAIPDMPGFGGRGRDDRGFGPGMGFGMGGFNLVPREGEEGAFDLVVPFRPENPEAMTDDAIAALADLGIRIVPREGDEGLFDLYVPAETLGEMEGGFILPHLDMFRGMMPDGFHFRFDGPMGRGFEIPDMLIPTVPAPEGEGEA